MLIQFTKYLTLENIYFWSNLCLIPFWLMIILIPSSKFTQFFINSIILPLILSATYSFVIYQAFLLNEPMLDLFKLYSGLDSLYDIFSTESFLLIFWLHFITLNLFLGSWISREGIKYNINKVVVFFPLILVYFTGPLGLVIYWFIRIFYAKKIALHD
jgi:hypothetical protein